MYDPHRDDNDIRLPSELVIGAARAFGGHFFPQLVQATAPIPVASMTGTDQPTDAPPQVQSIGMGLTVVYSFPDLESVEVSLRFRSRQLWHHTFTGQASQKGYVLDLWLVRIDVTFTGDLSTGAITWTTTVTARSWIDRPWVPRRGLRQRSVIRFDPSIGEIDGRTDVYPPVVFDKVYGSSQNCSGTILRFHVDEDPRALCEVGSKVKRQMFPYPYPPFVFNTVAAVGAFEKDGPQAYTDPESPWFNVFLGYYQIDCRKDQWDRPFGFHSADGIESELYPDDLVRLGKSDWNFFSNWDYGVPEEYLLPFCSPGFLPQDAVDGGMVEVAGGWWRRIELRNVEVASCYESDEPDAARLTFNTPITPVVRRSFGYPSPRPGHPESFVGNKLDAVLHMAYFEDDESYHTLIFGGTAHAGEDRDLLDAEVAAVLAVIADQYAHRGFAPRASRTVPARSDAGRSAPT
jgi:hypothetical protein